MQATKGPVTYACSFLMPAFSRGEARHHDAHLFSHQCSGSFDANHSLHTTSHEKRSGSEALRPSQFRASVSPPQTPLDSTDKLFALFLIRRRRGASRRGVDIAMMV